jgi:aminotransferase
MPSLAQRTELFTESVIRRMTRIALEHDAINLSQGFPDFDPPRELVEAAERALRGPHHQYAITWGAPRFRRALAAKLTRHMGVPVDPERNLVVTCGSTEAMLATLMSLLNPGERVIIFSPYYENYGADTILSGAEPIYVSLRPPEFRFDRDELTAAFKRGVKAIVVCNPSNPSGKVFTREELEFILALAEEHQHTYALGLPGAGHRVVMCGSLSKTYSITGWRLGYVCAAPEVIDAVRKVHDFLTVGAAAPLQEAAVTALELPDAYYADLLAAYAKKRDVFLGYLERTGLAFTRPDGAYYVMVDASPLGFSNDHALAEWLVKEIGVAGVPGSSFFKEPEHRYIRFHFAKQEQTLEAAGQRLLRIRERV